MEYLLVYETSNSGTVWLDQFTDCAVQDTAINYSITKSDCRLNAIVKSISLVTIRIKKSCKIKVVVTVAKPTLLLRNVNYLK